MCNLNTLQLQTKQLYQAEEFRFTERESEAIILAWNGLSMDDIANTMHISKATVRHLLFDARTKACCENTWLLSKLITLFFSRKMQK